MNTNEPTTKTCADCARLKPRNASDTALCLHCNRRFNYGEDGIGTDYFERSEPTTICQRCGIELKDGEEYICNVCYGELQQEEDDYYGRTLYEE